MHKRKRVEKLFLVFGAEQLWEIRLSGDAEDHLLAGGRLPRCCVSRIWLQWLFVVFQTISSCSPSHFTAWYSMQHWQSVRVWLPIMELFSFFSPFFAFGLHILIKPYIKTIEYWCLCFLFFLSMVRLLLIYSSCLMHYTLTNKLRLWL